MGRNPQNDKPDHLANMLGVLEQAQSDAKLLEDVWNWFGPYGEPGFDAGRFKDEEGQQEQVDDLRRRMMRRFKFDDSE